TAALPDQKTPDGYYNLKKMLMVIARKANIRACGSCMDARGIQNLELILGVKRSNMEELTDWIISSDKIIAY
ncbi:MAG: DsrE/DsrF/TusD sulfur relay family protein, partial [Candidatus Kariarchaeaceae archaeon]